MSEPSNPTEIRHGWWSLPFSVFQTNLREIDATLDVEAALDVIEGHGADTWLINTGGIVSFYPTDLPFQTRNPFLAGRPSGDLIGDAVEAAKARGTRVLARCDFSKVSSAIAGAHPEWLFVTPTGQSQVYNTLYSTCPSADYYQNRSIDVIDEILARYPVDGFFFNWFNFSERDYSRVYQGPCHCAACRTGFSAFSGGKELPDTPQHASYPDWLKFTQGAIGTLSAKIAAHIRERRDDVGLVLRRGAPIVYHEANNAFGRELWHHATSETVSAHVTGLPGIAVMVNSVSFVDMPYRMAGEQPEHFAQYLLQAIARGGNPSTYIMGAPDVIPYVSMGLAGEITRFYRDHRDIYAGLRPDATVGVVRPDKLRSADSEYQESIEEFRGFYSALKERHLPFDVLELEYLARMDQAGTLKNYDLLVLPHVGAIGEHTAKLLDAFVRAGGNVLLTGSSAIDLQGGLELQTAPAVMRREAPLRGKQLWSTYVSTSLQPDLSQYRYEAETIPIFGSYTRFVWKPAAVRFGSVLAQAPYGPPEKCYGHETSSEPAVATWREGGAVVQVPWTVGYAYREFGTTQIRDHLLSQIEALTSPIVRGHCPEQVELILGRRGDDLVVHLINQSGARRKSFGPHVPVQGTKLEVADTGWRAQSLVSNTELLGATSRGRTLFEVPDLGLFDVIVLKRISN